MLLRWSSIKSYSDLLWQLFNNSDSGSSDTSHAYSAWRPWSRRKVPEKQSPDFGSNIISGVPPLFALIIGINNYDDSSLTKLYGAVSDADSIQQYLVEVLKVPSDQIISLRNQKASRKGILDGFQLIQGDKRIQKNNPILIYFAGHGGELRKKDEEVVQTIFPQDYKQGVVSPIPDRTIAALLNTLSDRHGNNITVIFDCCHSGSGTRSQEEVDPNSLVRGAPVAVDDVPADLDQDICGSTRGIRVAKGFSTRDMRSHVLLAACSANERAREDREGGGRFTGALLKLLRTVGPEQLAYSDVLNRIEPIPEQNPQCEGFFRTRVFFDAKAPSPTRSCHEVKVENGKYTLQAGSANGITSGAEFTIYENKEAVLAKPGLGVMTTDKILPFTTTLKVAKKDLILPELKPESCLIAMQTKVGEAEEFRLHVPLQENCLPIFNAVVSELKGVGNNPCQITLVPKDKAHMEMFIKDDGSLSFNILDERLIKHGITQIPHSLPPNVDADKLRTILRAAAHYTFHLNHTHENNHIQNNIKLRFMRLLESQSEYDEYGYPIIRPDMKNLIRGGIVDFAPEGEAMYGIEISNGTPWKLHFHCLYFDNMDLSIIPFTEVNNNTGHFDKDHMLDKKGVATLGYGSLGIPPFQCELQEDLEAAGGFFKFYFTTEPIDLSHVPQPSPFDNTRGVKQVKPKQPPAWGTILVPIIQRRRRE